MQVVMTGAALVAGLKANLLTTYERVVTENDKFITAVMDSWPSDRKEEKYAYWESAPHVRRWIRGQSIPSKAFKGVQFSVVNYEWGIEIPWYKADREDDQTNGLEARARDAGMSYGLLDARVFYQIVTAATDPDLLPNVPNAPDGAALHAATAGGADRFGFSGGNIVTGTGVASSAAIRNDFFNALEAALSFQDTEGQPLLDGGIVENSPIVITYGVANEEVFREAFIQSRTHEASGAAVTNVVLESGLNLVLRPTQRITDNDWFPFFTGVDPKPIFVQERQAVTDVFADESNSDRARIQGIEALTFVARKGFGVAIPYGTVKVNN